MSKETKMVQVGLSRDGAIKTCWVENRPDLKEGALITLKDINTTDFWYVEKIYGPELSKSEVEMNRNWDNNNYDKHEPLKI